jgi:hypothetical protein
MAKKQSVLVTLGDYTPNRATVREVGRGHALLWYCPVHGAPPVVGERIYLAYVDSRPRCCSHEEARAAEDEAQALDAQDVGE